MQQRLRRPPAIPLVTIDPHTSAWCFADRLTDDWTRHWTGTKMSLYGVVRVDGTAFRFLGGPEFLPRAAEQTALEVHATRTVARFRCDAVELTATFTSALLPDDLDLLSRPVTYLSLSARPLDSRRRTVSAYVDMTGEWAVNHPHERVHWQAWEREGLCGASFRSEHQRVLGGSGDHRRIEWGTSFLAVAEHAGRAAVGDIDRCRDTFRRSGELVGGGFRSEPPRKVDYNGDAVAALMVDLPPDGTELDILVAYDDEWSVELMGQRLRPWWRRRPDADPFVMLRTAAAEADAVKARCRVFDAALWAEAEAAGGPAHADLLALSWRHAVAAHKLAAGPPGEGQGDDPGDTPLFFSKENFSNGCIATVDVTYPSAPLFLLHNPGLLRGMLEPVMAYCASPDWPHPFPAHDLGTYPLANGQTYRDFQTKRGPGENIVETQMPVEESGNMLVLAAALARAEGNASFARTHWAMLLQWAEYLVGAGLNPGEQLCTDDFSGTLGHNVNLSAKAIMGLGAFAGLAAALGETADASRFRATAEQFAARWLEDAREPDGTRLAFNQPGTWSLKYNLVWDRLLGLDLFPQEVLHREQDSYRGKAELYGVPLDGRSTLTKPEWMLWAACLTDDRALLEDWSERILRYANETPSRVPMSDLYFTDSGRKMGFQARSVLGGLFVALLARKWGV